MSTSRAVAHISIITVAFLSIAASAVAAELDVPVVLQQTPVWCWVAASEMAFRHYEIPNVNPFGNYQCGIIGIEAIGTVAQACNQNCALCNVPAGSWQAIASTLQDYPRRVSIALHEDVPKLAVSHSYGALSQSSITSEIDDENPILAGISPNGSPLGTSAHVTVVVGYRDGENGFEILVNDPFPYASVGAPDPYLATGAEQTEVGQYWISYQRFRNALQWRESFTLSKSGTYYAAATTPPPAAASRCCFNYYGVKSCPLTYGPALAVGQVCSCAYPNGAVFPGVACP